MRESADTPDVHELDAEAVRVLVLDFLSRFSETQQPIPSWHTACLLLKADIQKSQLRFCPYRIVSNFKVGDVPTGDLDPSKAILGKSLEVLVLRQSGRKIIIPYQLWVQIANYPRTGRKYLAVCLHSAR